MRYGVTMNGLSSTILAPINSTRHELSVQFRCVAYSELTENIGMSNLQVGPNLASTLMTSLFT